ncbi:MULTISPECIES: DUF4062 domain-containing protein [Peribacillus]|uniref:AbiJ-related protein n=1 Tax=Peribacillus TaxID=2675229 RepID=UPI001F4EA18B|nr:MULTISPECIES: DUF4062 domain-containing protein [unclassified Peribacillus]MCK1981989.1 DUF4062 domain-containing protein [Peribacillus sp. Aquil_B1]MCK2007659.1 DUF4062 domain-containing protein [Peribacillus sp. Aquil_B8]
MAEQKIHRLTRKKIMKEMLERPFMGNENLIDFLKRIWPLEKMESTDHRFNNAKDDIWQHMISNNDWEEDYLFLERLDILNITDKLFAQFIEVIVHPEIRDSEMEQQIYAENINLHLRKSGFELRVVGDIAGYPLYRVKYSIKNRDYNTSISGDANSDSNPILGVRRKLQVFVSSTFIDLREERQSAVNAILDAEHIPCGMEIFKAGEAQQETISKWIDQSDVYVLILGGRYGSLIPGQEVSYTHWEFSYAKKHGKIILPIVLSESYLNEKEAQLKRRDSKFSAIEDLHNPKYIEFKNAAHAIIRNEVQNIDQITNAIHRNFRNIEEKAAQNNLGWIRIEEVLKL